MTPIDYDDIDTPTWLRERRAVFLARHNQPPSLLQSGDYSLQLEMLADLFIEDYIWRWPKRIMDPRLWREQIIGIWEVHDESAVFTEKQMELLQARSKAKVYLGRSTGDPDVGKANESDKRRKDAKCFPIRPA